MTIARGTLAILTLVLALLVGGAGCGGAGNGVDTGDNSVVVIHLDIQSGVPNLYQIEVDAHLGTGGGNNTSFFPDKPRDTPIPSGATLALLIKPSIMDMLDLTVYGLDNQNHRLASGTDQINPIMVGVQVDRTIQLAACSASGC